MGRVGLLLACALAFLALGASRADAAGCGGQPAPPTTTVFLPNITKTLGGPSGWVTPFIVQNVGTKRTTLEVSFFTFADGALVACRSVPDLMPATSFADVPNNDTDLPADSQFSVVVRSYGSEVVAVVNEHQGLGVPGRAESLSYNGLAAGATTVYLPFVAKPASPSEWITTFVVQNFGNSDATVTARFTSYDGRSTATVSRTIAPGRSRAVDPSVEPQLVAGQRYSAVLTSTQPIGVVANAHDDATGSPAPRAFSYNGIAQPRAGDAFLPYVRHAATAGQPEPAGVLVQNAGSSAATPTLTFQRLGGGTPVTVVAPRAIAPGAAWRFDPDAVASPALGEHSLVVSGGTFAVLEATLAPGTATGYVGTAGQGNRAYLPNVTRTLGGPTGWTTPLVIQSTGATSATARWYRFSDGALVARRAIGAFTRGASVRVDPRTIPELTDDTQYGVVVDAQGGTIAAIVTELSTDPGDGAMTYEGFPATVSTTPAPTALSLAPGALRLGTEETAQLSATVKDQFDEVMPQQVPTWSVSPAGLGTVGAGGAFTAGATGGAGSLTATAGGASETIAVTVQPPVPASAGGISFLVRATGSADVYAETTVSGTEAASIKVQVDADIAQIQRDFGRPFAARPTVYVLGSDATYQLAQTAILGIAPAAVTSPPPEADRFESAGVYYAGKVAIDWPRSRNERPIVVPRHELTHSMIDQIALDGIVPAWLNEGTARLAELTVPGTEWLQASNTSRAVSMAANGLLFSTAELTSQLTWNARTGAAATYQYAEAQEIVRLLRNEVGLAGEVQILTLIGTGRSFEESYAAVSARVWSDFAASVPARLRALAPAPGIAFARDSAAGGPATGPTFVLYGYRPAAVVTITITGASTGLSNQGRFQILDEYGVYSSRLGTAWPPDTYTFTVTSAGAPTVTARFVKAL